MAIMRFFSKSIGRVWAQVLFRVIQDIFTQLMIPLSWGITNLVFIPKIAHPELITQFRPISLCNTLYKLVSRIVVQRLKPYMAEVINPC